MNVNQQIITMDTKARLSLLWVFVLLNVIFRDIHELFRPGMLEEMLTGMPVAEGTLLIAGIVLEIPIAMVILSRVLQYRLNRWANIIAGAVTMMFLIANGPNDYDDMWFLAVEVVGLVLIIWSAWRWRTPEA